ncbi:hypothetical protein SmJEL517_g02322 [Synchytrium microbalum]|uniref:SGF29 C-terminal domain-containing protein n=1 Tax=Synchytrium microbalum TaxID=1806994 RepID=A0A507C126_9FUNG|nr:uncharacterized protein SmJEL517_g02322 [Synchytrium microbalum]TPX35220.1 hypothetical protein SmJEL517_g02322 [Synchytrium microbalum]
MPEESELWIEICKNLYALDSLRLVSDQTIIKINKAHQKLTSRELETLNSKNATKLLELYKEAEDQAVLEKKKSQELVDQLAALVSLREASETSDSKKLKRKVDDIKGKSGGPVQKKAKSEASTPNAVPVGGLNPGDKVAVKPQGHDSWILAELIKWDTEKNKWEIEDVEADEDTEVKKHYYFHPKRFIPIPKDVSKKPEFQLGQQVLALYPGTSCFYSASVMIPPSRNRDGSSFAGSYVLKFEDDDGYERFVDPSMVLDLPTMKK